MKELAFIGFALMQIIAMVLQHVANWLFRMNTLEWIIASIVIEALSLLLLAFAIGLLTRDYQKPDIKKMISK